MGISATNESCDNESRVTDTRAEDPCVKGTRVENSSIGVITALVVTGFGIGWLAGLSVSPVVSIVLTMVTGSIATIIAALSGVKEEFLKSESSPTTMQRLLRAVTPVPLALLVVGLIVGSIVGVWVRTHNWLGHTPLADVQAELHFWRQAGLDDPTITRRLFEYRYGVRGWPGATLDAELDRWATATGLEQTVIAQRLFESSYSSTLSSYVGVKAVTEGGEAAPFQSGVLFAVGDSDCTDIKNEEGKTLRQEMQTAANPQVVKVEKIITDTVVLERIVKEVLCVGG